MTSTSMDVTLKIIIRLFILEITWEGIISKSFNNNFKSTPRMLEFRSYFVIIIFLIIIYSLSSVVFMLIR